MANQYPFIHNMNREDNTIPLSALPDYLKDYLRVLWEQGIIIEVWGVVSHSWQPMTQNDAIWSGKKYYRLKGDVHYACLKERVSGSKEKYVLVSDPTAINDISICYMSEGRAVGATIQHY